jgi:collagenase-like PrtC family protease
MRFAIGYQLPDEDDSTVEMVRDFRPHVAEVYFALPGQASGRSPLGRGDGWNVEEAKAVMREDLAELSGLGIDLVLLFNAACYGGNGISAAFARETVKTVSELRDSCGLSAVTTTSPFVARVLRESVPEVKVRASVNMRVGSERAMEYLAPFFDGYYLRRELNRCPGEIEQLKTWCDNHGKSLHLLANSGCLRDCAFQSFHDNLVAHESEAAQTENVPLKYPAPCWEFLDNPETQKRLLANDWIRPEDLRHYERWFDTAKLATRMHPRPRQVLSAYVRGRHAGNILDLLEPGHGALLGNAILDNTRFPADWHERVTSCSRQCDACGYCAEVLSRVRVSFGPTTDVTQGSCLEKIGCKREGMACASACPHGTVPACRNCDGEKEVLRRMNLAK